MTEPTPPQCRVWPPQMLITFMLGRTLAVPDPAEPGTANVVYSINAVFDYLSRGKLPELHDDANEIAWVFSRDHIAKSYPIMADIPDDFERDMLQDMKAALISAAMNHMPADEKQDKFIMQVLSAENTYECRQLSGSNSEIYQYFDAASDRLTLDWIEKKTRELNLPPSLMLEPLPLERIDVIQNHPIKRSLVYSSRYNLPEHMKATGDVPIRDFPPGFTKITEDKLDPLSPNDPLSSFVRRFMSNNTTTSGFKKN